MYFSNHLLTVYLPRVDSERRLKEHISELKNQVKGRDDIIQRLERDLKAKEELYMEVEEKLGLKDQAYKSVVEGKDAFYCLERNLLL